MKDGELLKLAAAEGYHDLRELGDAGLVGLYKLIYTYAIISGIGTYTYEDRWCYESCAAARRALDAWDGTGEPQGWHRHPRTGRRIDSLGNMTTNW